jgi:hypothetical protein
MTRPIQTAPVEMVKPGAAANWTGMELIPFDPIA